MSDATRHVIEQFPGGPAVDIPAACADETEACFRCGRPACAALLVGGRPACRGCWWRHPYATTETVPPGYEQSGSGI